MVKLFKDASLPWWTKESAEFGYTDFYIDSPRREKVFSKDYLVITFLAILSMSREQEIEIEQENNFKNIIINRKGDF